MRIPILLIVGIALLLGGCGSTATPTTPPNIPPTTTAQTTGASPGATPGVVSTRTATVSAVIPPATGTIVTRTVTAATPGAASGTSAAPSAKPITFGPVPWTVGERTSYTVTSHDNQATGTATYTIGGEFEAATISANLTLGATQDRWLIGFDGKTFTPASELRTIVNAQGTTEIRAEFRAGGATIEVIDRNGTVRNQITLPERYYAQDQFVVILRAIPFADQYQAALNLVPAQGTVAAIPTVITVTGQEAVTTPLGAINCWRVTAASAGAATQTLWYSVEAPNYLVKYDSGQLVYILNSK